VVLAGLVQLEEREVLVLRVSRARQDQKVVRAGLAVQGGLVGLAPQG